jgi:hypothetical protein
MVAVTAVMPERALVAMPVRETTATAAFEDIQVIDDVTSPVGPTLNSASEVKRLKLPGSRSMAVGDI